MRSRQKKRCLTRRLSRSSTWCVADADIEFALWEQLGFQLNWAALPGIVERELTRLYPARQFGAVHTDLSVTAFGHLAPYTGEADSEYDERRIPWLDTFSGAGYADRYLARSREQQLAWMQAYTEWLLGTHSQAGNRRLVFVTTEGWGLESILTRAHDEGWQIVMVGNQTNRDFWQGRAGVEFIMADDLPIRYSQAMVCAEPVPVKPVPFKASSRLRLLTA